MTKLQKPLRYDKIIFEVQQVRSVSRGWRVFRLPLFRTAVSRVNALGRRIAIKNPQVETRLRHSVGRVVAWGERSDGLGSADGSSAFHSGHAVPESLRLWSRCGLGVEGLAEVGGGQVLGLYAFP